MSMADSWSTCSEDGCSGARTRGETRCLAHAGADERSATLKRFSEGEELDVRGVTISPTLFGEIFDAVPDDADGHRTFPAVRFDRATFEGDARFDKATFKGDARFDKATFKGRAGFSEATFKGNVRFEEATFKGDAGFGKVTRGGAWLGTTFENYAGFNRATFEGSAWFDLATFKGGAWFGGATFKGSAGFDLATFKGGAWFDRRTTFKGSAGFEGATFKDSAWFGGATFEDYAVFGGATFEDYAGFEKATFKGHVTFGQATFKGDAGFGKATFKGSAGFEGASFKGDAGFGKATFKGSAGFEGASFKGGAGFSEATFKGDATFNRATFDSASWFKGATFDRATFENYAGFNRATFDDSARFGEATFKGDAEFSGVTFKGDAEFSGVTFEVDMPVLGPVKAGGWLNLDGVQFASPVRIEADAGAVTCRRSRFPGGVRFDVRRAAVRMDDTDLSVPSLLTGPSASGPAGTTEQPKLLSLQRANLAELALGNVNLAACRFAGAHNLDKLRLEADSVFGLSPAVAGWERRQVIAEETAWRADRAHPGRWSAPEWPESDDKPEVLSPGAIAVLYRALRKSREDAKDEPGAADFYYGEMEMRRHDRGEGHGNGGRSRGLVSRGVLTAYWLVSGYGLRAWRSLAALAVVMAVSAGVFRLWGFTHSTSYWKSLLFAFRSTLSLTDAQVNLTAWGGLFQAILRLTGPVLLALTLLALRGRVKR
jgi:Pentapeptide repeats (9 copies)